MKTSPSSLSTRSPSRWPIVLSTEITYLEAAVPQCSPWFPWWF
jgi:hypothetical protein